LEGLAQGHQKRRYETVDQQLLGDERFIAEVDRRTTTTREGTLSSKRVAFGPLLAHRLHRDLSMISRLAASYASHRDAKTEAQVRHGVQSRHER
jgi:hypothetical protein